MAEKLQEVGVHLGNNGNGRGGVLDNGGVHLETTEHGRTVN